MDADYACLGDVTRDVFFFINEANISCDLNKENCKLTLNYGEKIPVEKIGQSVGGNAANVSAGLAKLGIKAKLVTAFGDDDRSVIIKRELLEGGVDLENSITEPGRESNLSGIIVFKGERTILTYHADRPDPDFRLPSAKFFYITSSSGRSSESLYQKVLAYKTSHQEAEIAFNPSTSDLRHGLEYLPNVLKSVNVLLLNWEEAEILIGKEYSKNPDKKNANAKTMLKETSLLGPTFVAVTDGAGGSYSFFNDTYFYTPPSPHAPFETTGAGDAFSSGFLGSLFYSHSDVKTAIAWGAVNAGSVITKIGGQAGLLSKAEIEKYLTDNPEFRPKEI